MVGGEGLGVSSLVEGSKSQTAIPGTAARLYRREWANEWRIRCESELPSGRPPVNTGDRYTDRLSARAVTKIIDSSNYLASKGEGFSTFITLTVGAEGRKAISEKVVDYRKLRKSKINTVDYLPSPLCLSSERAVFCGGERPEGPFCRVDFKWKSSIQKEAGRFFDICRKMFSRGWTANYKRLGERTTDDGIEYSAIDWGKVKVGHFRYGKIDKVGWGVSTGDLSAFFSEKKTDLHYMWIAENPMNLRGVTFNYCGYEQYLPGGPVCSKPLFKIVPENPHIHVLIRWRVPWAIFGEWAKRLERAWGMGFAHIEKIKNDKAAASYLLKAVGYSIKGRSQWQGRVRGNRYGISQSARAPGWKEVCSWAWDGLGYLIDLARDKASKKYGWVKGKISEAKRILYKKTAKEGEKKKALVDLAVAGKARDKAPVFEKFGIVLKGTAGIDGFLSWIQRAGYTFGKRPPMMWLGAFLRKREIRKKTIAYRSEMKVVDHIYKEFSESWSSVKGYYDGFELVEGCTI